MATSKKKASKLIHRRAVLQSLALGFGAVGLGQSIFGCEEKAAKDEPRTNPTTVPQDEDEIVPGRSEPKENGKDAPTVPKQEWENRVRQLEEDQARLFRKEVFTGANPGNLANRVTAHVPKAEVVMEGDLKRVEVVVIHVMGANLVDGGKATYSDAMAPQDAGRDADADAGDADAGDADAEADADAGPAPAPDPQQPVHYITTIYLRAMIDGKDTVVGLYDFASDDAAPPTVRFTLPAGVTAVTAYEWCTLHGLWAGTAITI